MLWRSGRSWNWTWASWWEAGSVKGCYWVRPDCAGVGQVWPLQPLTMIRLLKRKIENSADGERRAAERITEGRHDWGSNEKDEWRVSHRPLSASYTLFSILFSQGQSWWLLFKIQPTNDLLMKLIPDMHQWVFSSSYLSFIFFTLSFLWYYFLLILITINGFTKIRILLRQSLRKCILSSQNLFFTLRMSFLFVPSLWHTSVKYGQHTAMWMKFSVDCSCLWDKYTRRLMAK